MSFKSVIHSVGDAVEEGFETVTHLDVIDKLGDLVKKIVKALPFDPADKANFKKVLADIKELVADLRMTASDTGALVAGLPSAQEVVDAVTPQVQELVNAKVAEALANVEATIEARVKEALAKLAPPAIVPPPT